MIKNLCLIILLSFIYLNAEVFEIAGEGKFRHIIVGGKNTDLFRQVPPDGEAAERVRAKQTEVARTFDYWLNYLKVNKGDPGLVREALERLGYSDGPNIGRALKAAKGILNNAPVDETGPAAIVTIKTLIATSSMSDAEAYENISYITGLLSSVSHPVRVQAAITLVSFGEKKAGRNVLLNAYKDPRFRRDMTGTACLDCVAWALGEIGDKDALQALREALQYNDLNENRKITIAGTLARLGEENPAVDALEQIAFRSRDKWSRVRALETLARLGPGNSRAQEALRKSHLHDSAPKVREAAGKILYK